MRRQPVEQLRQRTVGWAQRLRVFPKLIRIQPMTRKWGSCSTQGTLTLALDLLDEKREFQDFVLAHELLHLRIPNHGRLFKALMTIHIPEWRNYELLAKSGRAISRPKIPPPLPTRR